MSFPPFSEYPKENLKKILDSAEKAFTDSLSSKDENLVRECQLNLARIEQIRRWEGLQK
jgi:hypothetical protein